jgi:NAD(P)-dependent dehydrogenase (short-subunit alcohol dehydrogenase family)
MRDNHPSMLGRVCLVTGGNRGIGRATALGLARLGATVVLLGRDDVRLARAREEIARTSGNDDISCIRLDLGSLASVREAAAEVMPRFESVHVLVNNAGVNLRRRATSVDGHEMTFAVNHLGPFLLTMLLLPRLRASAPSRIVTVTSKYERWGRIEFGDLGLTRRYTAFRAYSRSKLANVLFTYELADRLRGSEVTANCIHPGLVATDLMRDLPRWLRSLYEPFLLTPERAARFVIRLAASSELEGLSGRYFERDHEARSSRQSYDEQLRTRLWRVSEDFVHSRHSTSRD